MPGRAAIVYSIPTPEDSPTEGADTAEVALNERVMNSVQAGGAKCARTPNLSILPPLHQPELTEAIETRARRSLLPGRVRRRPRLSARTWEEPPLGDERGHDGRGKYHRHQQRVLNCELFAGRF